MTAPSSVFVPAFEVLGELSAERRVLFVHGILGSGRNWASFGRRVVADGGAAILVDLRGHGSSDGAPPPHTVEACAEDVANMVAEIGVEPTTICGHSFGGKVVALYAERYAANLSQLFLLDAPLGTSGPGDVEGVLSAVRSVPVPISRRESVIELLRARQCSDALARWMTTNLERRDDGFHWRFELDVVEALLSDYRDLDLSAFAHKPPSGLELHVVLGGRSDRVVDRGELGVAKVHVLEEAGHWLHSDDPEGLWKILALPGRVRDR